MTETKLEAFPPRVLVVEDDPDIAHLIALHLGEIGCVVKTVHDGESGFEHALSGGFELLVLDVMLPKLSGTELCERLRARGNLVLMLMLTARSGEFERVLGLELGADDYLTKPFSFRELQARVKALLRRQVQATTQSQPDMITAGELSIDTKNRLVTLHGQALNLTLKEFELLRQFARQPGRVYTRAQLLRLVWGDSYSGLEHTVNTHINRLRTKLERDPAKPEYIQTVWGVGYRFVSPDA